MHPALVDVAAKQRPVTVRGRFPQPVVLGLAASAVYVLWTLLFLHAGATIWNFAIIGKKFSPDFSHAVSGSGYDGQFSYWMAVDPFHAWRHMDHPAYRYTRILYPMIARAVSLGRAAAVPYTLVTVNIMAVGAGTAAVAAWLKRNGLSVWLALIYALYPGIFTGFLRDLAEPVAYALVAFAVLLWDPIRARRVMAAAAVFGLAALARETCLLFGVLFALSLLAHGGPLRERVPRFCAALAFTAGPYLLLKLVLTARFGPMLAPNGTSPVLLPMAGFFSPMSELDRTIAAVTLVVPAIIVGVLAVRALLTRAYPLFPLVLVANILLTVVMLNASSYGDAFGSMRSTIGVVLATIYCIPVFDRLLHGRRLWLLASVACWLSLAPVYFIILPTGFATGG